MKGGYDMDLITVFPLDPKKELEDCTPVDVHEAYQHGYTAVIENGELLGFYDTKEQTP